MSLDLFSGCWFRFDCLFLNNQYKREKWVKIDSKLLSEEREREGELFNFVISRRNERDKTAEVEREFSVRERARERQRQRERGKGRQRGSKKDTEKKGGGRNREEIVLEREK